MQTIESDHGIDLPNIFNMTYIYKFIKKEIDPLKENCVELIKNIAQLCENTICYFIKRHFERFRLVSDAITERCKHEFDKIED